MCERFWIPVLESVAYFLFATPPTVAVVHNIQICISRKNKGERVVLVIFFLLPVLPPLKCLQTIFFPLWQSSYYVLCTFKCAKHHVCLAGPWDSRQKRDRLCFLSHGDVAFGRALPLDWLAERVSKQPHPVSQFLYIFCTQRAKRTFSPCTGKCQERKMYKTSAWGSSVSFAAEPACSRQAGWTLTFETAKQRK